MAPLARTKFTGGWGDSSEPSPALSMIRKGRFGDRTASNTLLAAVVEVADDAYPALTLVKLQVGDSPLLARLTRRSGSLPTSPSTRRARPSR